MNQKDEMNRWEQELLTPPFAHHGFNHELRHKIRNRLDEQQHSSRWPNKKLMAFTSFAMVAILVVILAIPWNDQQNLWTEALPSTESPESFPSVESSTYPVHSALLIGLRNDHVNLQSNKLPLEGEISTYRTLLVSLHDDQFGVTAEGAGLLIPYRQAFWLLQPAFAIEENQFYQYWEAAPANEAEADTLGAVELYLDERVNKHMEKVLFAGNRYISLLTTETLTTAEGTQHEAQARIHSLEQLQTSQKQKLPLYTAETRLDVGLSLQELLGLEVDDTMFRDLGIKEGLRQQDVKVNSDSKMGLELSKGLPIHEIKVETPHEKKEQGLIISPNEALSPTLLDEKNIAIVRTELQWAPALLATRSGNSHIDSDIVMRELNYRLPNTVVSYDEICCSWEAITSVVPDAQDAYSSPTGELVVILTSSQLYVHPVVDGKISTDILASVNIQPGETPVMTQWATGQYVEQWNEKVQVHLAQNEAK